MRCMDVPKVMEPVGRQVDPDWPYHPAIGVGATKMLVREPDAEP